MRGKEAVGTEPFSYVRLEERVPADHPLAARASAEARTRGPVTQDLALTRGRRAETQWRSRAKLGLAGLKAGVAGRATHFRLPGRALRDGAVQAVSASRRHAADRTKPGIRAAPTDQWRQTGFATRRDLSPSRKNGARRPAASASARGAAVRRRTLPGSSAGQSPKAQVCERRPQPPAVCVNCAAP